MNSQKFKCLTTRERIRLNSCSLEDFKAIGSPGIEKKAERCIYGHLSNSEQENTLDHRVSREYDDRSKKLQPINRKSRINADHKRRIMKLNQLLDELEKKKLEKAKMMNENTKLIRENAMQVTVS